MPAALDGFVSVMRAQTDVSPATVVVALTVGLSGGGLLGAIVAIPISTAQMRVATALAAWCRLASTETSYLQWAFASGPRTVGVGIVNGDALAVSYFGRSVGVVLYRIDGSTLEGALERYGYTWTSFRGESDTDY